MKNTLLALILASATLLQAGCAAGFRASGPNGGGVNVGAGVGNTTAPLYVPPSESHYLPPRVVTTN